jgi:hypothetical protein
MSWISVKNRPPDITCRCWCYVEEQTDLGLSHYQWNCCFNVDTKEFTDNCKVVSVTHWMPLPEPPTADQPTQKSCEGCEHDDEGNGWCLGCADFNRYQAKSRVC